MPAKTDMNQIVFTNKARCRDCYRCVRVCPVKAIRMEEGQAYVDAERCINCGTCIKECPQGAKTFRNDIEKAKKLLADSEMVAVSVAPSFAAVFTKWQQKRLASALRMLGFKYIAETAVGAAYTAQATADLSRLAPEVSHVCTACPAVVSYVEKYHHGCVPALTEISSPMVAHGRLLKDQIKNCKVVFIGPCVAKKHEAETPANKDAIDCVLTFAELKQWFDDENITLDKCEESAFDQVATGKSLYYPLAGGSLRTAGISTDMLDENVIAICGVNEITSSLNLIDANPEPMMIEPLFCDQGCINGPGIASEKNLFQRRQSLLEYARENATDEELVLDNPPDMSTKYEIIHTHAEDAVTEDEVLHVLQKTGKGDVASRLNCGACGYHTCHDQAVAVLQHMAEPEMCLPYMRRLAEQRTDRIIETSPNGIVILDHKLRIISMNPAFQKMFHCSPSICGKMISTLIDPELFETLAASDSSKPAEKIVEYPSYNLTCHQFAYPLPEEHQYVGIFVNITNTRANQQKLTALREKTIIQARELLDNQTKMAQKMAELLGQTTAQQESLVDKLMQLTREENSNAADKGKSKCIRDIYTSM